MDFLEFNDSVYGYIHLHPFLKYLIHTPEFYRLTQIKQMGVLEYIYPYATHSRYEHSIGYEKL